MYQNCCKKCGSLDLHTEVKGSNTGLYCSDCGAWIKWLGKDEIRAFEYAKLNKKEIVQKINDSHKEIQCAACGHLSDGNKWFNSTVHNKLKICPVCGTVRFVCDENRNFRR